MLNTYYVKEKTENVSCSVVSNSLPPARLLCPWDSPGKNTGVGCHSLFQGIFSNWGSNPGLPHRRLILDLSHQGSHLLCAHIYSRFLRLILLVQSLCAQCTVSQTNWKVRVRNRERFIAEPCKEKGGWCPKRPEVPEGFQQSIFKSQVQKRGSQGLWSACAGFSDWLMVREQGDVTSFTNL